MEDARVVLSAMFNGYERSFDLDLCQTKTINMSVRVAEHPVQDGSVVADHMYREPARVTLNGMFSVNGSATYGGAVDRYTSEYIRGDMSDTEWDAFLAGEGAELKGVTGSNDRLRNIELILGWIQKSGTLVSVALLGDTFVHRENMLIEALTLNPAVNSMSFNMSLREVITVKTNTATLDERLNGLYDTLEYPNIMSLGEMLTSAETNEVMRLTIEYLINNGYISEKDGAVFLVASKEARNALGLKSSAGAFLAGAGTTSAFVVVLGAVLVGLIKVGAWLYAAGVVTVGTAVAAKVAGGAAAAGGPVGWIVAAVIVAAIATVGIVKAVQAKKEKKRLEEGFNLIYNYEQYYNADGSLKENAAKDAETNNVDLKRLEKLVNAVNNGVKRAIKDVRVYQITSNPTDKKSRVFPLTVGDEFMYAEISVNNTTKNSPFSISLYTFDKNNQKQYKNTPAWSALSDLNQCSGDDALYTDAYGENSLYLVAPGESSDKLSDYFFIVSKGNLTDQIQKLTNTVVEILKNQGYEE